MLLRSRKRKLRYSRIFSHYYSFRNKPIAGQHGPRKPDTPAREHRKQEPTTRGKVRRSSRRRNERIFLTERNDVSGSSPSDFEITARKPGTVPTNEWSLNHPADPRADCTGNWSVLHDIDNACTFTDGIPGSHHYQRIHRQFPLRGRSEPMDAPQRVL